MISSEEKTDFSGGIFVNYNQTFDFNQTNLEQLLCLHESIDSLVSEMYENKFYCKLNFLQTNFSGCPPFFDKILCWPATKPNSLAILPCFREFGGVLYENIEGKDVSSEKY